MRKILFLSMVMLGLSSLTMMAQSKFVTTWASAQQVVEPHNLPPSPYLEGNSLRQIIQVSIGGDKVRLRLSNEFSREATEILGVEIAAAKTAGSSWEVDEKTTKALKFAGKKGVVMDAGGTATSDVVKFRLTPRQNVAVTIHYGKTNAKSVTGHPGSRTTSYIATGNTSDFSKAVKTDHWYNICALDVDVTKWKGSKYDEPCAIAVLGNSITDGRGTTTNGQDRWTDNLSRRLLQGAGTKNVAVLNFGLGGNCVLRGGLGPTAKSRYQRDLFGQEGVKYIILFEGVNDLGGSRDGVKTANEITEVYHQICAEAHTRGMLVFGATITPFKGNNYYSEDHEKGRQALNDWMRKTRDIDGLIDFDKAVQDPANPAQLNPDFLFENDWLHLNAKGYQRMGDEAKLAFFNAAEIDSRYHLPDPFKFLDGTRSTKLADWEKHRKEIISQLEKYEIGKIPPMDNMKLTAKLEGRQLTVTVTAPNGQSIDLKATITYPTDPQPKRGGFGFGGFGGFGGGQQQKQEEEPLPAPPAKPCPALIGISNTLPTSLFTERGCALVNFDFNTVCKHQQTRGQEPINKLYPELVENGAYSYWPWGVSRIIDGLQQLGDEVTKIDTKHLAISGCSWAGKAALWSGAMDDRICLVIPQESGGGGIAAWRVSETLGHVEAIGRTDGHWFLESMIKDFGFGNVGKLPVDHHQLAALVAPRALLFFGNNDYEWLADEAGYVSMKAVKEVYKTLGVPEKVGYAIEGGHGHCQLPQGEYKYVEAYIDRFLLGKDVNTEFEVAPLFENVDWKKWMW